MHCNKGKKKKKEKGSEATISSFLPSFFTKKLVGCGAKPRGKHNKKASHSHNTKIRAKPDIFDKCCKGSCLA